MKLFLFYMVMEDYESAIIWNFIKRFQDLPYLLKDLIFTESYTYVIKPVVANETQSIDLNGIIN